MHALTDGSCSGETPNAITNSMLGSVLEISPLLSHNVKFEIPPSLHFTTSVKEQVPRTGNAIDALEAEFSLKVVN